MNIEDCQTQMKQSRLDAQTCLGSSCMDYAAYYTSLMSYVRTEAIKRKQLAYGNYVAEMANGSTAAKSEAIMKSSDEYKEYLIYQGFADDLLEQVRTLRAKGKGDDSEKMVT